MAMMSEHLKNLLAEHFDKGGVHLCMLKSFLLRHDNYLNPNTGNVMAGKKRLVDATLRRLISIFTGWKAENICVSPNPGGRDAWSAGYWVVIKETGQIVFGGIDADGAAKQMIPEEGNLRPLGGFNLAHGFRTKEDCARAMLIRFFGVSPEGIGETFGPRIETEYADGEPLGDQAHPNRSSFFEVLYISKNSLKDLQPANGINTLYLLNNAGFHSEVAKLDTAEESLLSRMPEEARNLAKIFPNSFFEWHMNGAVFSYK